MERIKDCFCEGVRYRPEAIEDANAVIGGIRKARLAYHQETVGYRGSISHELKKAGKRFDEKRAQAELGSIESQRTTPQSTSTISEIGNRILMNLMTVEDITDRR